MPDITLNRADINKLAAFVTKHSIKEIFIAKDHGAYVGASIGENDNCIFYFKGCDPTKDKDFDGAALSLFGYDDVGEHLDASAVLSAAADPRTKSMRFTITASQMMIDTFR